MPEISVIIACLNGAATLAEALDSLAAQRWDRPWEIVFADNGSTDASLAIFAGHAARHPEVAMRLVDASARRGQANALNIAIRDAAGRSLHLLRRRRHRGPGLARRHGRALERHDFVAAASTSRPEPRLGARRAPAPAGRAAVDPAVRALLPGRRRRHPRLPPGVFEAVGDFDPAFADPGGHRLLHPRHLRASSSGWCRTRSTTTASATAPEAIYRQAYAYARAEALLRRRYVAEPRASSRRGRGSSLASRSARLSAGMAEGDRRCGASGSLLERARFNRRLGTAIGEPRRVARLRRRAAHPRRRAAPRGGRSCSRCCAGSTARPSRSRPTSG